MTCQLTCWNIKSSLITIQSGQNDGVHIKHGQIITTDLVTFRHAK